MCATFPVIAWTKGSGKFTVLLAPFMPLPSIHVPLGLQIRFPEVAPRSICAPTLHRHHFVHATRGTNHVDLEREALGKLPADRDQHLRLSSRAQHLHAIALDDFNRTTLVLQPARRHSRRDLR